MLSKSSKYGIRATLYIAGESRKGRRVGVPEIAESIASPQHFTAKIVQLLAKAGLLNSVKGPKGGFEMTEEQRKKYNIRSIVEVLDGNGLYVKCGLGLDKCNDKNPCPIHDEYARVRDGIIDLHTNFSIEELAGKLDDIAVLR